MIGREREGPAMSARTPSPDRDAAPRVIYSMGVSLDGFIAGPRGEIEWTAPDAELHRFHNEQVRELGAHLCGRGLYETMLVWETAQAPAAEPYMLEFGEIWRALPKLVFSRTLDRVEGNARIARDELAFELQALRREVAGDIAVGGAGVAAELVQLGEIDEYRPFVHPVVLGGGTPYLPPLARRLELELLEQRAFSSGVVYLRYRRR
jgi:dihydrofolate reductase